MLDFNSCSISIFYHYSPPSWTANKPCNRRLDSSNLTEHAGEIYCKSCYGKLFGPKGYGYGVGAGALSMDNGGQENNGPVTSNIPATAQAFIAPKLSSPPKQANGSTTTSNGTNGSGPFKKQWGGAEICPRCGTAVYMAEKMMGGGRVCLMRCATYPPHQSLSMRFMFWPCFFLRPCLPLPHHPIFR